MQAVALALQKTIFNKMNYFVEGLQNPAMLGMGFSTARQGQLSTK
jgi:hypothetical protein